MIEAVGFKTYSAYLNQNQYWITRGSHLMDVTEIGPFHAFNICKMLERRSLFLQFQVMGEIASSMSAFGGDAMEMAIEYEMDELMAKDPVTWIRQTPLYVSIKQRAIFPEKLVRLRNRRWRRKNGSHGSA